MEGVKFCGALSAAELAAVLPPPERTAQGPVAVIECVQQIPCNPCEQACPFGAIVVGEDITALPRLDREKCRGCGLCLSKCPGLAIFLVDAAQPDGTALVALPYEYLPLPEPGATVDATDREGRFVVKAVVTLTTRNGLTYAPPRATAERLSPFTPPSMTLVEAWSPTVAPTTVITSPVSSLLNMF